MKAGKCAILVFLLRVKTSIVLGVPRLGGKRVFTWRDTCENKSSFGVGMLHATRIERGGRILRGRNTYADRRARKRLAADGVNNFATNSKGGLYIRSLRYDRGRSLSLLRKAEKKQHLQEPQEKHASHSSTFTSSSSLFADRPGNSGISLARAKYLRITSGFRYSSCSR